MEISINFSKPSRNTILRFGIFALFITVILLVLFWPKTSPIPKSVSKQANFKTVYPSNISSVSGGQSGFNYLPDQKAIAFEVSYQGVKLNVTEQTVPDSLAGGTSVYFQSLGLHPIAQFSTGLGPVAIVNFYRVGSLESAGQSGLLVAGKTMVLANTSGDKSKLSNDQWKSFFDGLRQSK